MKWFILTALFIVFLTCFQTYMEIKKHEYLQKRFEWLTWKEYVWLKYNIYIPSKEL